jgi:hypothetical protein
MVQDINPAHSTPVRCVGLVDFTFLLILRFQIDSKEYLIMSFNLKTKQ